MEGNSMEKHRRLVICTISVALLMTLIPPWQVREREQARGSSRRTYTPFGPEHAGGYSLILIPPEEMETAGYNVYYAVKVARLDIGRLLFQYVLLALAAGVWYFTAGVRVAFRRQLASECPTLFPLSSTPPPPSLPPSPHLSCDSPENTDHRGIASSSNQGSEGGGEGKGDAPKAASAADPSPLILPRQAANIEPRRAIGAATMAPLLSPLSPRKNKVVVKLSPWWKYQSLSSIGFTASSVSLLVVLLLAALDIWALSDLAEWQRTSRATLVGRFVGCSLTYFGLSLCFSYAVWILSRRSMDWATAAFCVGAVGLFVMQQVGQAKETAQASAISRRNQPPSTAMRRPNKASTSPQAKPSASSAWWEKAPVLTQQPAFPVSRSIGLDDLLREQGGVVDVARTNPKSSPLPAPIPKSAHGQPKGDIFDQINPTQPQGQQAAPVSRAEQQAPKRQPPKDQK